MVLRYAREGLGWTSGGIFFTERLLRYLKGLSREVVESLSVEMFKESLEVLWAS